MIKNRYRDESIVWLARTVRMIQLCTEILKSINGDTDKLILTCTGS